MDASRLATVVVVDDNAATRYSTGRILQSAGFNVVTAATGFEAIDIATTQHPDLVVLDINLPDIDGFQICRELRQRPATKRTPIIYLSATFVDDTDKIQGVEAGADGYLTHPVEPPVLVSTVNALLRARAAEDAVAASEARFKVVFENALNGIALLSADLVFIDVNPAMCRIFGREREGVIGRHLSAFSVKEHQPEISAMTSELRQHNSWRGTAPVLSADGGHVDLDWTVSMYTDPGVHLAIVSDVTARLAFEAERERLLRSERSARADAEQANRVKDEFLAALSHELRTPLNAIVGFARLLQRTPAIIAEAQVLSNVNAIERNAWVQAQLISDLLDISRITSGKLALDRQQINPADAVDAALQSIRTAADAKRVTLNVSIDAGCDTLWWDPSRFQQVVWNLVDNAVKFSTVGGVVDIDLSCTAEEIAFVVHDTGRGISPDFLPHVFDRFRQEDSTSRRGHGGLGLGLAIVYQLVVAHGGSISADSEGEGHGSTFTVRLPRTPAATVQAITTSPQFAPAAELHHCRILIVDDNDDARALMRQIMSAASARTLDAATVDAAIDALETFKPHVLISDLAMPDQDGFDLIRRVRALGWDASRLPAIALSAYARAEDRDRALAAGFQSHISKPPDVNALLNKVAQLFRNTQR